MSRDALPIFIVRDALSWGLPSGNPGLCERIKKDHRYKTALKNREARRDAVQLFRQEFPEVSA